MRALDLELKPRGRGIAGYVLAAAVVAFALHAALDYRTPQQESAPKKPIVIPTADPEAYKAASETVRRLAAPWDRLFDALEAAQTERVALISLEPDPENGTLLISGEAKDYLAALTYLARLSEQPALSRAHLQRHEARKAPQASVGFTISARWQGARTEQSQRQPPERQKLQAFYAGLQRGESQDEWLAKLYAAAGASGLEFRAAQYRLTDARHRIERYEISLPVSGTYAQMRRFLDASLAEIPVMSLDRASFRRKTPTEGRVEAEIVFTLHLVRA